MDNIDVYYNGTLSEGSNISITYFGDKDYSSETLTAKFIDYHKDTETYWFKDLNSDKEYGFILNFLKEVGMIMPPTSNKIYEFKNIKKNKYY